MAEIDEKAVYQAINESRLNTALILSAQKNQERDIQEMKGILKEQSDIITGNGTPEKGIVYRQAKMEEKQAQCPIKDISKAWNEFKAGLKFVAFLFGTWTGRTLLVFLFIIIPYFPATAKEWIKENLLKIIITIGG